MSGAAERARIILIQDDAVAVISRQRNREAYYVLPGGGIEPGESPADAAMREALEELGLIVRIVRLVEQLHGIGAEHTTWFFLVQQIGGVFGQGSGVEMSGLRSDRGGCAAQWLPLDRIGIVPLYPCGSSDLIRTLMADNAPERL